VFYLNHNQLNLITQRFSDVRRRRTFRNKLHPGLCVCRTA
jgi:hypothetical protein